MANNGVIKGNLLGQVVQQDYETHTSASMNSKPQLTDCSIKAEKKATQDHFLQRHDFYECPTVPFVSEGSEKSEKKPQLFIYCVTICILETTELSNTQKINITYSISIAHI